MSVRLVLAPEVALERSQRGHRAVAADCEGKRRIVHHMIVDEEGVALKMFEWEMEGAPVPDQFAVLDGNAALTVGGILVSAGIGLEGARGLGVRTALGA